MSRQKAGWLRGAPLVLFVAALPATSFGCSSATDPANPWNPIAEAETLATIAGERLLEVSVAADGSVFFAGTRGSYRVTSSGAGLDLLGPNPVPVVRISAVSSDRLFLVGGFQPDLHIWNEGHWRRERLAESEGLELFDVSLLNTGDVAVSGSNASVMIRRRERTQTEIVSVVPESTHLWHVTEALGRLVVVASEYVAWQDGGAWHLLSEPAHNSECRYLVVVGTDAELWVGGRPSQCLYSQTDEGPRKYAELGLPAWEALYLTNGEVQPDESILLWGESGLLVRITSDSVQALEVPARYFAGAAIAGDALIFAFTPRDEPSSSTVAKLELSAIRFSYKAARERSPIDLVPAKGVGGCH